MCSKVGLLVTPCGYTTLWFIINYNTYFRLIPLRRGGIFKQEFVSNLLTSPSVEKVWKSVNIWWSYEQEFGVLFFLTHGVFKNSRILSALLGCALSSPGGLSGNYGMAVSDNNVGLTRTCDHRFTMTSARLSFTANFRRFSTTTFHIANTSTSSTKYKRLHVHIR